MQRLIDWFAVKLADTQLVMLFTSLLLLFVLLIYMGDVLAPLLVALVLAYLLDGIVGFLHGLRIPRIVAIVLVCLLCLLTVLFILLTLIPLLSEQFGRLLAEVPHQVAAIKDLLKDIQAQYAGWINPEYIQQLLAAGAEQIQAWGKSLLTFSLASIPGLITLMVYCILVPVVVFFILYDKTILITWFKRFLPRDRALLEHVWADVDVQIGNYIRGKFWETMVVGIVTWLVYWWLGLEYAVLLGVLTGFSVWVPFVGAAVVTVPVVLLAFFQWGWADQTLYALGAYAIIQALDANLLVPWLFSEVVNLHPIAIVVAVLVFGGMWGVLGVFCAIPLASLVKSVLNIVMEKSAKSPQSV
ncbi:MAG: AI-2E family transporter [Mariprofundaceae bacterium]